MNSLKEHISIITLLVVDNEGMLLVMKLTIETFFYYDCRNSRALIVNQRTREFMTQRCDADNVPICVIKTK